MNCSRNDVVLLPIPFTDLTSRKVRPAVVIGQNRGDLFVVPVSSVLANTDFLLAEWSAAGLNVPSGVKAQLATVEERLALKIVGKLAAADLKTLNQRLRMWLDL
ncbi:MAG TPA: type II toxin-antitoxin system PemK/MazF family toxin [Candidatus Sulfotelmatobacter sp.]|nr:type II toxin-antitoxin system PemK/MazF family toxin [Candidatus Sulfotelmatobacter sp.]